MTRIGKIFYGILICLIVILLVICLYKYERIPTTLRFFTFLGLIIFTPLLFSFLFQLIFRNAENKSKLQWLPNTLSIIGILIIGLFIGVAFNVKLTNSEKWELEQKHIDKAVSKWIKENAQYPDSYIACTDTADPTSFFQASRPLIRSQSDDPEPIGYYITEHPDKYEYALYFLKHKHILKSKSGSLDTVVAYFELNTDLKVQHVWISTNDPAPTTANEWREKYGNKNKDLALELNGNDPKTYYFRDFNWDKEPKERLVPYANGKVNGVLYRLYDNGDTSAKISYKEGMKDGPGIEMWKNTRISFKGNYVNGKLNGLCTWWYCNGQKEKEGMMENDAEVGVWKSWDENGGQMKAADENIGE